METRDPVTERKYKNCRNAVRNKTRRQEQEEQQAVANECKTNVKRFWTYIKRKNNLMSGIWDIKVSDATGIEQVIDDDEEKSNLFADYFSSVFNRESEAIFDTLEEKTIYKVMSDLHFSEEMVYSKLSKLKVDKSPGADMNIHENLKSCALV